MRKHQWRQRLESVHKVLASTEWGDGNMKTQEAVGQTHRVLETLEYTVKEDGYWVEWLVSPSRCGWTENSQARTGNM